jgi:hypothetical protein
MATCPFCNTNFSMSIPTCSSKCKFCKFPDENLDQSVREEFNSLLNPSGVTRVPKYDDDEE